MNTDLTLFEAPVRTCKSCRLAKPITAFHLQGNGARRRKVCAACRTAGEFRARRGRRSSESRLRERLMCLYGITLEQYQSMLAAQGGVCAICATPPSEKRRLVVDHCHRSGLVRALLCSPCNTQLGAYEKLRDQAVEYLAKYGAGNPLLSFDTAPNPQRPAA